MTTNEHEHTKVTNQESAQDLRTLMEQAPVGIVTIDMAGLVTDINPAALQILGSPSREVSLGLNVLTLPALVESGVSDLFRQVLENGEAIELESEYRSRWGKQAYLHTRLAPRYDARGKQVGVIQILEDISKRKRVEEALALSTDRYGMAAEAAQVGVWDWNLITNEFYLDPIVKGILGYTDAEMPNDIEIWAGYVHPDDQQAVMEAAQAHIDGKTPEYFFEHRMMHKDGSVRWVLVRGKAVRDEQGIAIRLVGTDTDITPRKQAEILLERQLRYEHALAQCSQTLLQTPADDEQQIQILNEALAPLVAGAQVGRAYIFRNFRDPELGDCMSNVAEACAPGVKSYLHIPLNQRAPWALFPEAMHRTLEAGRPWGGGIAESWGDDRPELRDRMLRQPLLSVQFFPIFFGDQWWGFVGFDDLEIVRQWDDEEIMLLGTASEIFSSAMQRWQAERALQEERDELEARVQVRTAVLERRVQMERVLATAAERLMTQEDFGKAIEQTLQEVGELVDAAVTLLVRIDAPNRSILASYRWKAPDIPEMPFVSGPDEDWLRQQVHTRKPLYLPDVEKQVDNDAVREGLLKREMRAIALYPLVVEGDIAGVFHVSLRQALTEDNADDTFATLDVMATLLNGLLQRQVLLENLEQRVLDRTRELAAVLDVAVLDVDALELADVVKPMLPLVSELARSQAVSVHLLTEDGTMQLVAQQGLPAADSEHQASVQMPAHLADWLQTESDPILATTADALAMLPYQQATAHFDAGLVVQIGGRDRPQGILACYRRGGESFSLNQIALAAALADYMGTIIENHLLRRQVEDAAIVEERQRLARDLHDSVSQSLYGVTLFARAGRDALAEEEWAKSESSMARAEQNALQALKEMRLLLHQLQPLALEQGGLAGALKQRFDQVERRIGVHATCDIDPAIVLSRPVEEELYRLASEALNNALKHADATEVGVRLEAKDDQIILTISDDGRGFNPARMTGGMGLDNMRHRAERLDGELSIESQPGQGTVVRCVT